jgi:hypothetical protein
MKKQNFSTLYQLAKALGYKQVSNIYPIADGRAGLSSPRLVKLMQLAGKLMLIVTLAALLFPAQVTDAQAQVPVTARALCIM